MAVDSGRPHASSPRQQAAELLSLARDRSAPGRAAFVFDLYDLCAHSDVFADNELAVAIDILIDVVLRAPVSVRQPLAERLARDPQAPHAVVITLARDEISVAFPVLSESPVLGDRDLLEILRDRPLEHQLGALQRETLSEEVSAAFVEGRNPLVMRWLLENPGAAIPLPAMEILVEASRAEAELQRPLAARSDLPQELAAKVYAWASDELRQRLAKTYALDMPNAAKSIGSRDRDNTPIDATARALDIGLQLRVAGELNATTLIRALRSGNATMIDALFARFCHISVAGARRVLGAPDGTMLASILRANNIDKSTFATIYMLLQKVRNPGSVVPPTALAKATSAYDRVSMNEATRRLTALQATEPEETLH
jgi:uncharacterized protein (DUF2336 family)